MAYPASVIKNHSPIRTSIGIPTLLSAILVVVAAAWLNVPIFYAYHLEAYSMSLLAMATDLAQGGETAMYVRDPSMEIITQYLYLTRPLAVWMLAGAVRVVGIDAAWPTLVASGWLVTVCSCMVFCRDRNVGAGWAFTALMLCQGLTSATSSWNETVLWTAPATLAAALIRPDFSARLQWRHVAAGAFVAVAFSVRQDGLLGGLLVACLLAGEARGIKAFLSGSVCVLLGFLGMLCSLLWAMDVNPVQAFDVAKLFTGLRQEAGAVFYPGTILFLVGAPLLILLPLHVYMNRKESLRARICQAGAILAIWLASTWIASNPRYIVPVLLPLVSLWGGGGLRGLASLFQGKWKTGGIVAVLACTLLLIMPPALHDNADGPNVLLGRAAQVMTWLSWQKNMREDTQTMERIVEALPLGRTLIITSHYDDDAALRLETTQQGWRTIPQNKTTGTSACRGGNTYEDDNGRQIIHVRTVAFYAIAGRTPGNDALIAMSGLSCAGVLDSPLILLTTAGASDYYSKPAMWGTELSDWMRWTPRMRSIPLSHVQAAALLPLMATQAAKAQDRNGNPLSIEGILDIYRQLPLKP